MTLEANIEAESVAWAESRGWHVRKTKYIGANGCPDREFIGYGHILKVEFKRPNAPLNGNQKPEFKRHRDRGVPVYVFDNLVDLKELLARAAARPRLLSDWP